ncbi:MAG: 50S ribosomal protein L15 [Lentisphaeria bacterium]|nr:50S ribosomal protein L15 [Lentisphaeria bacterium]
MKLHELENTVKRQTRNRVGRGDSSGNGKTAGRGNKGAGQRSGYSRRPHFEGGQIPLFRRLPKRGFNNPNHKEYTIINISILEENFEAGEDVSVETLRAKHLLGKKLGAGVKILGDGEITKALKVTADKFSASAVSKIETAGGTCTVA